MKRPDQKVTTIISTRFTPRDVERIRLAAAKQQRKVGDFVRLSVLRAIENRSAS